MVILKFETIKPKNFFKSQNYQGYSVNYIPHLNSLLVYGVLSNCDPYLFSLSKKQWSLIKTSGKKPTFRRFYAHYYLKSMNGLLIHGGQIIQKHKKLISSDQFYILLTNNWQWRKIFLQQSPPSRQFHSIIDYQNPQILNKNQFFVFGGFSKPYQTVLNDLWSFKNIQNLSIKTNKHQVHGCQSRLIHTKGNAPYLYGYSAKVINKKILFFGGQQQQQKNKLQIYALCLQTFSWQALNVINKVCPSLKFLNVFESAIDFQKIHIFGGIYCMNDSTKQNDKCYYLSLKQMQIFQQSRSKLSSTSYTCCITQSPLCVGSLQYNFEQEQIEIKVLYEKQPNSAISKHFQTDQLQDAKQQQVSIQQYLKAIKHEQILSQQLIKKNMILEQLYKQIQRYISVLYAKYLDDQGNQENQQIEREKQRNIRSCEELKQNYLQNVLQFQDAVKIIKNLRGQLGQMHQDFQRCIQTQIDQQQN